jgi:hypothetical protein
VFTGGGGDAVVASDGEVFLQLKINEGGLRRASFAEKEHGGVVLTEGIEWRRRLGGKLTVDGGVSGRMVPRRDEGGVDGLRRCGLTEEEGNARWGARHLLC